MRKTVLILSGGLDSACLLYHVLASERQVSCLSFNYGQRHRREINAALHIGRVAGVPVKVVDISGIGSCLGGSSQTDRSVAVPEGKFDDESMKQTVVPNRNMIMLAIAEGYAISQEADTVAYGAHGGDHAIYPDCRPNFVRALNETFELCDWHPVPVEAPFLGLSKGEVLRKGLASGITPLILGMTWTCYKGGEVHCGKCGACQERLEAFEFCGLKDPVPYTKR